jgi:dimethyladenosine transferase
MKVGKRTGTHILINDEIARRIVSCVNVKDKIVLEVGPGSGSLTKFINGYKELYLIELQEDFRQYLLGRFPNSTLIVGDALKIQWPDFQIFISNLPYNISTPILEKLQHKNFEEGVVMVQKEVAKRILASPGNGDYSRLSVSMQLRFKIKKCFDVSPGNFLPAPKVQSTVLHLEPSNNNLPEGFDEFLKKLFSERRKMISTILGGPNFPHKRPEELTPKELLELYSNIKQS